LLREAANSPTRPRPYTFPPPEWPGPQPVLIPHAQAAAAGAYRGSRLAGVALASTYVGNLTQGSALMLSARCRRPCTSDV
jgi:hypothetical protein